MTERVPSGLMRGCWRRSDGPLEGDTRPKRGETARPRTLCSPPRQCPTLLVVLCRTGAAEVLAQSRRWFTQMGLMLNEQKTRVCDGRREAFTFLGYTFGPMRYRKDGHWYLGAAPAKKAVKRGKGRIRQILRPGNQGTWDEVRDELNRAVRGWANYFAYGTRLMAYQAVDNYVDDRVRHFLRRRHKVPTRGTKRYPAELIFGELGVFQLRRFHLGSPAHARV